MQKPEDQLDVRETLQDVMKNPFDENLRPDEKLNAERMLLRAMKKAGIPPEAKGLVKQAYLDLQTHMKPYIEMDRRRDVAQG